MKLARLAYTPEGVLDFHEAGLTALGADCARTWHDRLEVLAESRSATLWNPDGSLHAGELHFVAADAPGGRDAARDVFPGCPLTFALAEALRASPLSLDRVVLAPETRTSANAPTPDVAEKLWRAQFPDTHRWRIVTPFTREHHFSLLALARCEIQAIDQHWMLARVAVSLPDGAADEHLAREFATASAALAPPTELTWPVPEPARWAEGLRAALAHDLTVDLAAIRERQQTRLQHEWARIDEYFENYARELTARTRRSGANAKAADRLAAAKAEQARHRADQVARHETIVHPHLDALLLVAEPAWHTRLDVVRAHEARTVNARFIPRARRWVVLPEA